MLLNQEENMPSIAFAVPITSAAKGEELLAALTGEKKGDHHEANNRHGFTRIKLFRQHKPQEMVVVYLEADNLEQAIKSRMASDHSHDKLWGEMVKEATGQHPNSAQAGGPPSTLLMDWHPTKGVATTHHD
jgi:hypothetical protein